MRIVTLSLMTAALVAAADDPKVLAFMQRADQYAKIRDSAEQKVTRLPNSATPEQITQHERELVTQIRTARASAKQGDVFTADVQPIFLQILKDNFAGPANKDSRATARQGNPGHDNEKGEVAPVIQVNAVYSKTAPLSTVPPALLAQLPKLPKDIEYRFVGQTLILWDNISNLIIDYMKGAAPGV